MYKVRGNGLLPLFAVTISTFTFHVKLTSRTL